MGKASITRYSIAEDFEYPKYGISSQALLKSVGGKVMLYVFAQGAELKTHKANSDVLVVIQEGTATITLEGETFDARQGTSVVFKEGQLHSLKANEPFKMLLIK
ncbi:cupin domain-containing protein [Rhodocytophaga aerolata]|uniref:Cupin domain-containing protein n=1 Tax=Rhodocytophaga aerolata TaxID=455078 RepID=A0ABT8RJC5_9BACT|nr:cupin domain-containing protein [Rhodocytophaga aerolata]MDO1450852.1 cupin domain-containing protein [Rhodocytophaga aerolata]